MTRTETMVKNLVEKFQDQGLEVLYAQCSGFPNPTKVQGVEPDVVGWDPRKEIYHLGLVADDDLISSDIIKEKINILANMMMGVGTSEGTRLPFYLGLSKNAFDANTNAPDDNLTSQDNIKTIEV
jgi:hypothetical protein